MNEKGLLQGYVILKHNGNIVYDDYNTITANGRQFILSTLYNNIFIDKNKPKRVSETPFLQITLDGEEKIEEIYKLAGIGFGYNVGDRPDGVATLNLHNDYVFSLLDENNSNLTSKQIDFVGGFLKFSLSVKASDTKNVALSELGLYLVKNTYKEKEEIINAITKSEDNNDAILFSRISFDPIPMVPSTELLLDYYIYV